MNILYDANGPVKITSYESFTVTLTGQSIPGLQIFMVTWQLQLQVAGARMLWRICDGWSGRKPVDVHSIAMASQHLTVNSVNLTVKVVTGSTHFNQIMCRACIHLIPF